MVQRLCRDSLPRNRGRVGEGGFAPPIPLPEISSSPRIPGEGGGGGQPCTSRQG